MRTFALSTSRLFRALILAGFAYSCPLAAGLAQGQIANELPAPPTQRGDEPSPALRSVLVPPASDALLPPPRAPALTPPAATPSDATPSEAEASRGPGYLGLIGDLDHEGAGIRVLSVHEGGPAADAGFRENDLITAVNGQKLASIEEMTGVMTSHFAGDSLKFDVRRGERPMELTVTLGAMQSEVEPGPISERGTGAERGAAAESPPVGRPRMGIHVATVTDALRGQYGVDFRSGALITGIQAGSPADRAGLPAGGVIYSIDGQPVEREEDVVQHIAASRWGQEVELGYRYNDEDFRKSVRLTPPDPATAPPTSGIAAGGEARVEAGRPLTVRRRVVAPGGFVPPGPGFGRIQRMIQAYGGPYIRFAPEVYVEESAVIEAPGIEAPGIDSPPARVPRSGASQQELDQLRRRVTELEDELAAEKAATP